MVAPRLAMLERDEPCDSGGRGSNDARTVGNGHRTTRAPYAAGTQALVSGYEDRSRFEGELGYDVVLKVTAVQAALLRIGTMSDGMAPHAPHTWCSLRPSGTA